MPEIKMGLGLDLGCIGNGRIGVGSVSSMLSAMCAKATSLCSTLFGNSATECMNSS